MELQSTNVHINVHPPVRSLRKVTITDVARAAKVSIQTVSAIVNRKPGISEPTRDRVLRVIEQLRYRPNGIASSLRAQRRCIPSGWSFQRLQTLSFPNLYAAQRMLRAKKDIPFFFAMRMRIAEKEIQYLWLLQRHRVAGILVSSVSGPAATEAVLKELALNHMPIACLGARRAGQGIVTLRVLESEITRVRRPNTCLNWGIDELVLLLRCPPSAFPACALKDSKKHSSTRISQFARSILWMAGLTWSMGFVALSNCFLSPTSDSHPCRQRSGRLRRDCHAEKARAPGSQRYLGGWDRRHPDGRPA